MTYNEVTDYISNSLTSGSVYGLDRIKELLKRLSSPEKSLKIIHIAGTNGKGSISRMIMSVLKSAGFKVGIFNSPFLTSRREYLCINGEDCSEEEYALIAGIVKNAIDGRRLGLNPMDPKPTEFEFSFAMALEYFARKECEFAIVECGLGGKTDATNIFEEKELSILANIGLDHTAILGDTIEKIAKQKCGIIIKNDTVVAYPSEPKAIKIIKQVCKTKNARLILPDYFDFGRMSYYDPGFPEYSPILKQENIWVNMPVLLDSISLKGSFQKKNGMVALSAIAALIEKGYRIPYKAILKGFTNVKWPGRFEKICDKPLVYIDGGHNVQCATALCKALDDAGIRKAIFVIGIMADKDYESVFKLLAPYIDIVIATEPPNPRRLKADKICSFFKSCFVENSISTEDMELSIGNKSEAAKCFPVTSPSEAIRFALDLDKEQYSDSMPIIVTGSLYMISEIKQGFYSGVTEK